MQILKKKEHLKWVFSKVVCVHFWVYVESNSSLSLPFLLREADVMMVCGTHTHSEPTRILLWISFGLAGITDTTFLWHLTLAVYHLVLWIVQWLQWTCPL
jgi:hypothetical protein